MNPNLRRISLAGATVLGIYGLVSFVCDVLPLPSKTKRNQDSVLSVDAIIDEDAVADLSPGDSASTGRSTTSFQGNDREREKAARQFRSILNSGFNAQQKREALADLTKRYVRMVGIDYALANLEAFAGPGKLQNRLLVDLFEFSESGDQEVLVEKARSLKSPESRRAAIEGLFRNMRSNGLDPETLSNLFPLKKDEVRRFDYFLRDLAVYPNADGYSISVGIPELLKRAFPDEDEHGEHLREFLLRVTESNPKDVLDFCLKFQEDPAIRKEVARASLQELVRRQPEEALNQAVRILDADSEVVTTRSLGNLIAGYMRIDSNAALEWIESNSVGLSAVAKDGIAKGLVDYEISKGGIESARTLLPKIQDVDLRKEQEGKIWERERTNLHAELHSHPSVTVNALVSGASKYDTYWLEEAVYTWVTNDFGAASAWYDESWRSLPAEKAQYVAAGFATQAISQGDADTARQWAEMIQDTKTRERIEGAITKAAGE